MSFRPSSNWCPPISKQEAAGYSARHKMWMVIKSMVPPLVLIFAVMVVLFVSSKVGLIACIVGAGLGVFISYSLGLALLGFLLLIGSVEIIFEWRSRLTSHLLPLDRYGQIVSAAWYLLTVGALIGIMWYFAGKGDEILRLPLKILQS